jgi:predicted RNA polymerase sigma factor
MRREAPGEGVVSPAELAAGVWRIERSRLVGAGARLLRDLDEAEDCAQDALLAALDAWPRDDVPSNPAAWLMTATRNKALDRLRRRAVLQREHEALAADDAASRRAGDSRDCALIGHRCARLTRVHHTPPEGGKA